MFEHSEVKSTARKAMQILVLNEPLYINISKNLICYSQGGRVKQLADEKDDIVHRTPFVLGTSLPPVF